MIDEVRLHTRGEFIFQDLISGDTTGFSLAGVNPRGSQSTVRDDSDDAGESVPGLQFVLHVHV